MGRARKARFHLLSCLPRPELGFQGIVAVSDCAGAGSELSISAPTIASHVKSVRKSPKAGITYSAVNLFPRLDMASSRVNSLAVSQV